MNDPNNIKTANAVRCTICGHNADLMKIGIYICQDNPAHVGDTWVVIFVDMTWSEVTNDTKTL